MTKFLSLIIACALLSGCSSWFKVKTLYEVRLTSGSTLYAKSKPALVNGDYVFKDVNDQRYGIAQSEVFFIEPKTFEK